MLSLSIVDFGCGLVELCLQRMHHHGLFVCTACALRLGGGGGSEYPTTTTDCESYDLLTSAHSAHPERCGAASILPRYNDGTLTPLIADRIGFAVLWGGSAEQ